MCLPIERIVVLYSVSIPGPGDCAMSNSSLVNREAERPIELSLFSEQIMWTQIVLDKLMYSWEVYSTYWGLDVLNIGSFVFLFLATDLTPSLIQYPLVLLIVLTMNLYYYGQKNNHQTTSHVDFTDKKGLYVVSFSFLERMKCDVQSRSWSRSLIFPTCDCCFDRALSWSHGMLL